MLYNIPLCECSNIHLSTVLLGIWIVSSFYYQWVAMDFLVHVCVAHMKASLLGVYLRVKLLRYKQSCAWMPSTEVCTIGSWAGRSQLGNTAGYIYPALINTTNQFSKVVLPSDAFWGASESSQRVKNKTKKQQQRKPTTSKQAGNSVPETCCVWLSKLVVTGLAMCMNLKSCHGSPCLFLPEISSH